MKLLFLINLLILKASCAVTFYSVDNYQGRADNPFKEGLDNGMAYLEDFENRQFNIPPYNFLKTAYAQAWNGAWAGSPSWGVREDYSSLDSDGGIGWVWTNSGGSSATTKLPAGIHFDFTPDAQGRLPEYVGAALTGFSLLGDGPSFNVILVYDRNGVEVTDGAWQIPKPVYNPNLPIEDLFLNFEGIYVPGGISRIHFRDFSEVDHLTYGYAIPEPGSLLLTAAGAAILFMRRRSRIP